MKQDVKLDNVSDDLKKSKIMSLISLFTSAGTRVCCALPALLVTLGAGATLAGLVSTVPWLVALSKYKIITFSVAGFMLLVAGFLKYKAQFAPCSANVELAQSCMRMRKISTIIYALSVLIYLIGFFFAFIAVHIFY
jgi:hypothetical protein